MYSTVVSAGSIPCLGKSYCRNCCFPKNSIFSWIQPLGQRKKGKRALIIGLIYTKIFYLDVTFTHRVRPNSKHEYRYSCSLLENYSRHVYPFMYTAYNNSYCPFVYFIAKCTSLIHPRVVVHDSEVCRTPRSHEPLWFMKKMLRHPHSCVLYFKGGETIADKRFIFWWWKIYKYMD